MIIVKLTREQLEQRYKFVCKKNESLIEELVILNNQKPFCSFCNPKTMCKKHKIEQGKILVELAEELDLAHEKQEGKSAPKRSV